MKEILARRLKQCRKEAGLKQWQIATYCNITEKTYQNYELKTREPKLEILVRIADQYHVSLDYLVGRTDQPQPYPKGIEKGQPQG
ncbi:MAG: helix-turn-helix transcriptional regulator [Oscillospiraceae bacterium]|nr:helix-turn-helix transcriptional regulator [Oscillospiraceae bacterium]MBQ9721287.1 helix-turn-helix transcriptional regulator [Oscillospiraceae bacterium]